MRRRRSAWRASAPRPPAPRGWTLCEDGLPVLRLTKKIDAACVNPLLKEVGAASLAPFEHTPLFCASTLHGAATAAGAEQMALANQLATLCLDRGARRRRRARTPASAATVFLLTIRRRSARTC